MVQGLKKKVAAHHRKQKKLAKKDPTWRSNLKKDPGIPASFPYKEQILQEIEQQREEDELAEEKRKAERDAKREAKKAEKEKFISKEDKDVDMDEENPLGALLESAKQVEATQTGNDSTEVDAQINDDDDIEVTEYDVMEVGEDDDDDDLDFSQNIVDKVLDVSDIILYILDARNPEATRSKKVEDAVLESKDKRLIFILNKIDLVETSVLKQWTEYLEKSFPTIPLISSSPAVNATVFEHPSLSTNGKASSLLNALKNYSAKSKNVLAVGVLGYPNVGKSSVINSLLSRKIHPTNEQAGTTTAIREVTFDDFIFFDSPGIAFPVEEKEADEEARLTSLGALPLGYVTNPAPAVTLLLKTISKNPGLMNKFKDYYDLLPVASQAITEFTKEVLIQVARNKGRIGKKGVPNSTAAAGLVLQDWREGRIVGWSNPESVKDIDPVDNKRKKLIQKWNKEFKLKPLWNN